MDASAFDEAECQLSGYAGMVAGARPDHALFALDTAATAMVPFIQAGAIDRRAVSDCLMETSERQGFIALHGRASVEAAISVPLSNLPDVNRSRSKLSGTVCLARYTPILRTRLE